MLTGYARVSTDDQETAAQVAALKAADAARLFKIHPSTLSRLLARAICQICSEDSMPNNLESDSRETRILPQSLFPYLFSQNCGLHGNTLEHYGTEKP
jgi:hypothetical protein